MNQEEAFKETRNKDLTTILTEMGVSKDSFMEIDLNQPMKTSDGQTLGGNEMIAAMDRQASENGHYDIGITGSNNGVYAAYVPGGKYIVTKDAEVIKKLQSELGFKDKGLGVAFSNGERPTDSYVLNKYNEMDKECAKINRNREWSYNEKKEAQTFDGIEVDGFKFSFEEHSDTQGNKYVGSVKTPDGQKIDIMGSTFSNENKFGKMAAEFSSKEFEEKVYSGEIKKEDVMARLTEAEHSSKKFEADKQELAAAKATVARVTEELNTSSNNKRSLDNIEANLSATINAFSAYAQQNPKKAEQIFGYINDVVKSAANGSRPKTANPLEPHGFFGKMKANIFGQKKKEAQNLDQTIKDLAQAIKENPEAVKESLNNGNSVLPKLKKDISERAATAAKDVQLKEDQLKTAQGNVSGATYAVAQSAVNAAKLSKLKESVSKVFSDKEAAQEIELRKTARETNGSKDADSNSGMYVLGEKERLRKENPNMPVKELYGKLRELQGIKKDAPSKPVKKTTLTSEMTRNAAQTR